MCTNMFKNSTFTNTFQTQMFQQSEHILYWKNQFRMLLFSAPSWRPPVMKQQKQSVALKKQKIVFPQCCFSVDHFQDVIEVFWNMWECIKKIHISFIKEFQHHFWLLFLVCLNFLCKRLYKSSDGDKSVLNSSRKNTSGFFYTVLHSGRPTYTWK